MLAFHTAEGVGPGKFLFDVLKASCMTPKENSQNPKVVL